MNAIDLLLKEHNNVRALLTDISNSTDKDETKKKLFDKLCENLIRHEKMEELVWYPQLKQNKELYETIKHLIKEEKGAEKAIEKLHHISPNHEEWETKFEKFKSEVEHHASEEETELFPQVKKIYDAAFLEQIGKDMLAFERDYSSSQ